MAMVMVEPAREWSYRCHACGDEGLDVREIYTLAQDYTRTLRCTCGEALDGIAAVSSGVRYTTREQRGELDDGHRVDFDENEESDEDEGELREVFCEVFCEACVTDADDADDADWGEEADEPRVVATDRDYIAVECGGCGREVEFGWSHSDRGGRIWPVEASDFKRRLSWPEPRYREAWGARGWLRREE